MDPTCSFGNPNLKPETSTNVNGSIGGRLGAGPTTVTLEGIGFYRRVRDLIVDVDDGSGEGTTITANRPERVKVRGLSPHRFGGPDEFACGNARIHVDELAAKQRTGRRLFGDCGNPQEPGRVVAGLPSRQTAIGAMLTINRVGEMFDTVSGFGSVPNGDYLMVDLSGRIFIDVRRRHRISLRLENLFDERYTTLTQRGFFDDSGTSFLVHNLGTPRTFHLSYGFAF